VEKCYAELPQDFAAEFGYGRSADGSVPIYSTRIDEFRRRKLSFSKTDFGSVPMAREYGFLGFNLVSFGGRVYALAQSMGLVELTTMSADELAGLPSAKTLDKVKYLVAISTLRPVESVDGLHREFQMQQREIEEMMPAQAREFEAKLALLNRDVSIASARLADDLKQARHSAFPLPNVGTAGSQLADTRSTPPFER
jgi:hypothetical protein